MWYKKKLTCLSTLEEGKTFVQHIQIAQLKDYMTFKKCFEKIKDVTQLHVEQKLILLKHVVFLRLGKSIDLLPGKYRVREHH